MKTSLTLSLISLFLLSCAASPGPNPSPAPVDTDLCMQAQVNLLTLQCKDSRGRLLGGPNLHNEEFHLTCENAQNNSVWLNPRCLSTATSCTQVAGCANEAQ